MRKLKIIVLMLLFVSVSLFAEVVTVHKKDILKKVLKVDGMTCVGCEVSLEKAVLGVKGVLKVKASVKGKSAYIEFDKTKTDVDEIKKVINIKGYTTK